MDAALPSIPILAEFPGRWEIVLILAVVLIFFGARKLPEISRSWREREANAARSVGQMNDDLTLWLAQGFNVGRIPFAPGLFGSLVGLLWFGILLAPGNFWLYLAGALFGLGCSVWLCGAAERILKQTDPPSIVLDEITAIPICYSAWVASHWFRFDHLPALATFFTTRTWLLTLLIFALFRILDVVKPWPIRPLQRLPGGWGVTADDLLAALGVALLTLILVL